MQEKQLKNFILFLFLINSWICSNGQSADTATVHRIKIKDISVVLGGFNEIGPGGSLKDFRTLAPNSALLKRNFDNLSEESSIGGIAGTSVLLGIHFRDGSKLNYRNNPVLFIGFGYFVGDGPSDYFNSEKYKLDTIVSSPSGGKKYVDSMMENSYNFSYRYQQIRIEGLLSYRITDDRRFSVYSGIGFSAGLSVNAITEIQYAKYLSVVSRDSATDQTQSTELMQLEDTKESFKNKTNYGITIYFPMRFDLRIGSKNSFLKRNHIFYELRAGMSMEFINGLNHETGAIIYHCIGYRLALK
jgi:hypothetical protein